MSTMLPEEMSGGRRMEGNSICAGVSHGTGEGQGAHWDAYEALVFGEQHRDAGVDLADGERDEHGA